MAADYPTMTTAEIRSAYLNFFESKGCKLYPSSSLVPDDPSLLLANAGMNQFKEFYQGKKVMKEIGACSCQKCVRTNDIDIIGADGRHASFFEMLGNFAFGGVTKGQACAWAYELITEVFKLPKDRLYFTVFTEDDETEAVWRSLGVEPDHITRLGEDDNFWAAGPTGPCGPCSEIYFDLGEEVGCGCDTCAPGCDCDRFLEFWNLVFTQFDRQEDGSMPELPHRNLDTGMGLERMAAIMQHKSSFFDGDVMQSLIKLGEDISGKTYVDDDYTGASRSLRIIADHARSVNFLISDGVLPGNEGRGYVLRRLLRRAARHGRMLGVTRPFLAELCDTVIRENGGAYPELVEHADYIKKTISAEEERFSRTIDQGLNILSNLIDNIEKAAAEGKRRVLAGIDAFKLNDTFGFPLDLTKEIAAENGIEVDEDSFRTEMQKQREKARKDRLSRDISGWTADLFGALDASATEFLGYGTLEAEAKIVALSDGDELTDAVSTDDGAKEGVLVVLDRTPFYAESGGQVADTGVIATAGGAHLAVTACKKTPKGYYVHTCTLLDGVVQAGDKVIASVERDRRHAIMRNHTGAHLLQKALREVLGAHVHQAGSYEDDERVRFDFTHFNAVTPQELAEVERIVNAKIFEALPVHIKVMPLKEAKELGAMALFGEKYGDIVRVVDVEGFSTEFCGGTHVSNTAELGCFKILSESSVAAGIRRIEGTTGYGVLRLLDEKSDMLNQTAGALKVSNIHDLPARAAALTAELRSVQKELDDLKQRQTAMKASGLFEDAKDVDGIKIFTMYLTGTATDALRKLCDNARDKAPASVTAVIGEAEGKTTLAVAVGKEAQARGLAAGKLVKEIAAVAGGNGGGKPDFAMAGIKDTSRIDDALNAVPGIVKAALV